MVDIISISLKHSGLQIGIYILAALLVIALGVFIYYQRWFFYFYVKTGAKGTVYYHLHRMTRSAKNRNESPSFYLNKYFASFEFLADDSNTIQELDAINFWHKVYLNYTDDFIESLTRNKIGIGDIEYFEKKIFDVPLQENEIPAEKNSNSADILLESKTDNTSEKDFHIHEQVSDQDMDSNTNDLLLERKIDDNSMKDISLKDDDINEEKSFSSDDISIDKRNDSISREEEKTRILNVCIKQAIIWANTEDMKKMSLLLGNLMFTTGLIKYYGTSAKAKTEQFRKILNGNPASSKEIKFTERAVINDLSYRKERDTSLEKVLSNLEELERFFKLEFDYEKDNPKFNGTIIKNIMDIIAHEKEMVNDDLNIEKKFKKR